MGYRLVPYTAEWEQASARSNARLRASGAAPFFLPERAAGPQDDNRAVRREHYLVLDDGDEVRGGCLFQYCQAWVDGAPAQVVNVQSPLSEGLFDLRYAGVAPWMIREIVRRHPLAYCVGMGGEQLPFPRLLRALGWRVEPLPFYFRVLAGRLFLANMQLVRKHPRLGPLATAGGVIPVLPDLLLALAHTWRTAKREPQRAPQRDPPPHHDGPVDWTAIRTRYAFAVERTPDVLDALYPPADPHFLRIQVPGGFGVLRTHQFRGDSYFGNLRVATLVEAICQPEAVRSLLRAALDGARGTGAGLLITNQSAPELQTSLKSEGWFSYRSNYLTGLSLPLATRIGLRPCYINRGDGDGLLNL